MLFGVLLFYIFIKLTDLSKVYHQSNGKPTDQIYILGPKLPLAVNGFLNAQ